MQLQLVVSNGLPLVQTGRQPLINRVQFYQCLEDSMTVKHTSSFMFVSLDGPPVMLFEPLKYVNSWLVLSRRSAVNSQGPSRKQEVVGTSEMKSLWKIF